MICFTSSAVSSMAASCAGRVSTDSYSIASGMELFFGARSKKEMQAIEKSLTSYQRIGFSPEIGELALDIVKKYAKSDGTSEFDAIIAATAMTSGFTLATRNRKHFRNVHGLSLEIATYKAG